MSENIDLQKFCQKVEEVALGAGSYLIETWENIGDLQFKNRRDIVTESDLYSEKMIVEGLSGLIEGAGFSSEEKVQKNLEADYLWIIDPIDGTKYYSYQMPIFSVSIALFHKNDPVLGVIYNPASRQLFSASKGSGAYLNKKALSVERRPLNASILSVDVNRFDSINESESSWCKEKILELISKSYRVRMLGNGSLSLCYLASGALDAYIDITGRAKIQDKAAGFVIAKEAGAILEEVEGARGPKKSLAANPVIFEELKEILRSEVSLSASLPK